MLKELINNTINADEITEELLQHSDRMEKILEQLSVLSEKVGDVQTGSLDDDLQAIMKQFDAARRGLGLANKLTPGPSKAKHASRIMGNMNKIRAGIKKVEKTIAAWANLRTNASSTHQARYSD